MMKQFLRKLPTILIMLFVGGLLVYGFWPTPVEVDLVRATRGRLQVTVRDDGETRIKEKYIVSAPVEGKLMRLEIHPGDVVCEGETILARIEPGDPALLDARSKAQAEARVRAAAATQQQSHSSLKQRGEVLELARHDFERASQLTKTEAISTSDFDRAEHHYRIAQTDVRSAEFAVKIADFELELAKAALIRTQNGADESTTLTIHSPINGRVLRVFHEDSGMVTSGTQLLELGDSHDLEMKIDLLSTDAVRVRPGAKVFVEQWGGAGILEGEVRLIEPSAFLKISALGVEEKRVNVIADFTTPIDQRESLGDGYRIEARIVVSEIADAIKVPSGTLFRDGDQWCVFQVIDGRARQRPVEVGEADGLETQVRQGFTLGDPLILHPTDKVRDGIRVYGHY